MEYRNLSKYEKLAQVRELHLCRAERHEAAVYLNALRLDNREIIEQYESFGDKPYQFLKNKRSYDRGLLFGFTDRKINRCGWLENEDFSDREHFEFPHRKNWAITNYTTIGRGHNGKWTYGASYATGGAGGGYGISVWGKVFDTRKECLSAALREIMDRHKAEEARHKNDHTSFNSEWSRNVVRQVKDLYDTLTGRKAIQLSLF
jgi:hypothetical protein